MKTLTGGLYCAVLLLIAGCKSNHLEIFPELSQPQLMNAELSPEQLRADVDAFIAGVIDRHPDISRYADLAHIHQQARLLKDELTTPMTRQVFYKKIGALSHLFYNGHTFMLWPYQEYQALKQSGARPFPFALDVFPQGVFLKYGYQFNDQSLPKGTRLLSINNVSVETIFTLAQHLFLPQPHRTTTWQCLLGVKPEVMLIKRHKVICSTCPTLSYVCTLQRVY